VARPLGTGYRLGMPRRQPDEPGDAGDSYVTAEPYDPVAEQEEARRARADRDWRLSPAERLQRLHDLCAQLASMTPAVRDDEQ